MVGDLEMCYCIFFLAPSYMFFLLLCCVLSKLAHMGYFRVSIYGLGFLGTCPVQSRSAHDGFFPRGFLWVYFCLRGETD